MSSPTLTVFKHVAAYWIGIRLPAMNILLYQDEFIIGEGWPSFTIKIYGPLSLYCNDVAFVDNMAIKRFDLSEHNL